MLNKNNYSNLLHSRFYILDSERRGFTLVELILVMGMVVILSAVSFIALSGRKSMADLDNTRTQITAVLRESQSKAVSWTNGTTWGVHFDNTTSATPFFAQYRGSAYSAASVAGGHFGLPASIAFGTSTLPAGTSTDVLFNQISGSTNTSATINIYMRASPTVSSTIWVDTTGAVRF